jgi:hypothetical protein
MRGLEIQQKPPEEPYKRALRFSNGEPSHSFHIPGLVSGLMTKLSSVYPCSPRSRMAFAAGSGLASKMCMRTPPPEDPRLHC